MRFERLIRWFTCFASSLSVCATASAAAVALFDGDLNGWDGDKKVWRVVDGTIVGGSLEGNPQNEFLTTRKEYKNFRLRLEYKLVGTEGFVNGGVQIRSRRIDAPPNEMMGYQADIGAGYTGCLYDESRRKKVLAEADKELVEKIEKKGDWNRYEIVAEGNRIQIFLNGQRTVDYTERETGIEQKGLIGLQIHGNCKAEIAFRNIIIDEFDSDLVPEQSEILQRFGDGAKMASEVPVKEGFKEGKFELKDEQVVVLIGQENLVREQRAGELEARLLAGFGASGIKVRSMAWEGDTVYVQWRDLNFGSWAHQLRTVGADVVMVQFGQSESFDGPERISEFKSAYHRFLDEIATVTKRVVMISPMLFEKSSDPHLPDLSQRNEVVKAYAKAAEEVAKQRGLVFVDLVTVMPEVKNLTDDGWHLNAKGLVTLAEAVTNALGGHVSSADWIKLKEAIVEKNRLWFDCWRPANWSFVYGDRVAQFFGKPVGDEPSLKETFEQHKPLIAAWDQRIAGLLIGKDEPLQLAPREYVETEGMISAEEQLAGFEVAEGYAVNLFASEELGVAKPVQMTWDERGRLWVACSPSYPHALPGMKPGDFILVLEDVDGDGRADRSWKFAEGLRMVQGLELGKGGLYVCDFDQLLHLRDTDGDGKADEKEVIFSGFGIGDTHQLVNSISYGPDGKLWMTQGLHAYSRVETPHGLAILEKAGVWRMDRRSRKLEAFFQGGKAGHNCWGVVFDDYGQVFHKTGDRPHGYWTVPGLTKNPQPDEYHPVGPLFETSPKTTSMDIIGTKGLPEEIQGTVLIGGYFGSVLELHRLIDAESGFRSEQLPKLMRSKSNAFRPVDVSVGPDGAMYFADWFNPVIGHYQASYADPRRDRKHGRIWRISAKGYPKVKQPDLASMDATGLLRQLESPERWTRYQAKRLLFDLDTQDVLSAADAALPKVKDERLLLELAGIYEAHGTARKEVLEKLMTAQDARVRAYGARVAGAWLNELPQAEDWLRKAVEDEHPRVRLEAVVSCSYLEKPDAVEIVAKVLELPMDRFLDYALIQSLRALEPQWREALAEGKLKFGGSKKQMEFVSKLAGTGPVKEHPGKIVYDALCLNCHQPGGVGLPGVYPPLAGSEWMTGEAEPLIKIVLHGLTGPVNVKGQTYGVNTPLPMPPMGLEDQQVADVLTYLRSEEFGNKAAAITAEQVAQVRSATTDRTTFWTAEELGMSGQKGADGATEN